MDFQLIPMLSLDFEVELNLGETAPLTLVKIVHLYVISLSNKDQASNVPEWFLFLSESRECFLYYQQPAGLWNLEQNSLSKSTLLITKLKLLE